MSWTMPGMSAGVAGRIKRAMLAPGRGKRVPAEGPTAYRAPGPWGLCEGRHDMETGGPEFGAPAAGEEQAAVADILAQAFAMTPQDSAAWVEKAGLAHLRVLREKGMVTAT